MPAPDWAQKILCIIVPNRRTASPEFFSWVRTRRLLTRSRLVYSTVRGHPWRPRGSQSGPVKRRDETLLIKHGRKSPWVPTLTGPFPNGQVNAGSWLGTKNALYYCAQSANSFSWVLFVSSYKTAIVSITACLAHAPKKCTQSGNFQFDIKSPSDPTRLLCQMQANSSGAEYPSSWREWILLLLVYVLHKTWN